MEKEMEALNAAKIQSLQADNEQLKNMNMILSAHVRARQELGSSVFESQNNLRASVILLEEKVAKLQNENQQFTCMLSEKQKEINQLSEALKDNIRIEASI